MNTNNITIEKLSERLNGSLWIKGDLKRIYLNDEGYNTKKMSTKTFVFEKEGEFIVSCHIECPSQGYQWISSQEEDVKNGVYERIERAIAEDYFLIKNDITGQYINCIDKDVDVSEIDESDCYFTSEKAENYLKTNSITTGYSIVKISREEFEKQVAEFETKRAIEKAEILIEERFIIATDKQEVIIPEDTIKEYVIGANYNHARFGVGVLISEDKNTVRIKFECGEKHLLKAFAKLEQA